MQRFFDNDPRTIHDRGASATSRLLATVVAILAPVMFMAVLLFPGPGDGAEGPRYWQDGGKPVASFLFTNEEVLARMREELGLTEAQLEVVRRAGREEALALEQLEDESEAIVSDDGISLEEKQALLMEMDFNGRAAGIIGHSRTTVEAQLTPGQMQLLPGWIDGMMQEQRRLFAAAAIAASGGPGAAVSGTYRVYATQYHSNFGPDSVDVAVPDKYVKFASLGWEYHSGYPQGGNYSVNLSYNGNRLSNVQVKDCGPWNIDDNFWNDTGGSRPRRLFGGLTKGMPEAQAAYFDGYNGGKDQFGRTVLNPAGIDLSPKAGVQLGLGYLVSGWVEVSFNWESSGGSLPVYGAIGEKYAALSGILGQPVSTEYDVPGGRAQDFNGGRLIWNRSTGRVCLVKGDILVLYDSLGGPGGMLGHPTGDEAALSGGKLSTFERGRIYWSPATGARVVYGGILARYVAMGGTGALGFPTTNEEGVAGGRVSRFEKGRIYWSSSTGAWPVYGAVLNKFEAMGGPGSAAGMPVSYEYDIPGGRAQDFSGCRVVWNRSTGNAYWLRGDIMLMYDAMGGPGGSLGHPASDESDVSGGKVSAFERGRIYWSRTTGARAVYGGIMEKYVSSSGPGKLGFPVANEEPAPGGRVSRFIAGRIYWSPRTGAKEIYGGILGRYLALGGPTRLGMPVSDEYAVPGGRASDLQVGRLYWSPDAGTFHVMGEILRKYDQVGGPGALGRPMTDELDLSGVPGTRMSRFSGGAIIWAPWRGSRVVQGEILRRYESLGGAPALGLPVTDEADVDGRPGARFSQFDRGWIYWSPSSGAHLVYGEIYRKYTELGGPRCSLGLPTSDEYAIPGGRRTDFQGGYITWDLNSHRFRIEVTDPQ